MLQGPCLAQLSTEAAVHNPLWPGTPAEVLSLVRKSGVPVSRHTCRIAFIDGKYDAGLAAPLPGRQFRGSCHGRSRSKPSQSPALPPPVDEESPEQPRSMVIRPAGQPGSPRLQGKHPDCFPAGFNDIRPPGLFRQTGQCHAQRITDKYELSRCQFQESDCPQVDGACIRPQIVQGNEPDGLDCSSQLPGVSVLSAGASSAGGPARSIHMTSQRCPSGSWKLWLYINP